jgi:uncharacterized membrane protein YuzA (DUF378 family)
MYHNHHSPVVRLIGHLSWLLTAIAAIAWGLVGLGAYLGKSWNIWESDFLLRNAPWLIVPAQVIIGLLGLMSLIMWAKCLGHCHDDHKKH